MADAPNFIIIGRAKAGTTSLYRALSAHPDIYMSPVKEPGYFVYANHAMDFEYQSAHDLQYNRVFDAATYRSLFAGATTEIARGEASTIYTFPCLAETAAEAICTDLPDTRLIAIIRHPAETVHSLFYFWKQYNFERARDITTVLDEEATRRAQNWYPGLRYLACARSYPQLKAYFDRFPSAQIRVYLHDEWNRTPQTVLADIYDFLGADPSFRMPATPRANRTKRHRFWLIRQLFDPRHPVNKLAHKLVPHSIRKAVALGLQRANRTLVPPLEPALRARIIAETKEDILQLQDLTGKDLTHWLT